MIPHSSQTWLTPLYAPLVVLVEPHPALTASAPSHPKLCDGAPAVQVVQVWCNFKWYECGVIASGASVVQLQVVQVW